MVKGDSCKGHVKVIKEGRTEPTTSIYRSACSLGNKQEKLELHMLWHYWRVLGYLRYSETACTTGILLWKDRHKLLSKGRADEDRGLSSMSGSSLDVWNLIGQTTGWLGSCGSGTEEALVRATDHAIQVRKPIKSSLNNLVSTSQILVPVNLSHLLEKQQILTSSQDFLIETLDKPEITQS